MTTTTNTNSYITKSSSVFFLGWIASIFFILISSSPSILKGVGAQSEGDLRIVPNDPAYPWAGRLDIFLRDSWGTICYTNFDYNDATVACRRILQQHNQGITDPLKQMEFYSANIYYPPNYGDSLPIWMTNVSCTGTEDSLLNCSTPIGVGTSCNHYYDVGVTCQFLCPPSNYSSTGLYPTYGQFCNLTATYCTNGRMSTYDTVPSGSCSQCNRNYYGYNCASTCPCTHGVCSVSSSACATCDDGFTGYSCIGGCTCNSTGGKCSISPSSSLTTCSTCNPGFSGSYCNQTCGCVHGTCFSTPVANASSCASCHAGWTGPDCNVPCECEHGSCSSSPTAANVCAICDDGWTGPNCNVSCNCANGYCATSPSVPTQCIACKYGWAGIKCDMPCTCQNGTCSVYPNTYKDCVTCNPGFYGGSCNPCKCPAGGGVCNDGSSGTGECYPEGTLRLVGGTSRWNGLLEVWLGAKWGTMCSTSMNSDAADIMCRQLVAQAGLPVSSVFLYSTYSYSASGGTALPIVWQSFSCPANVSRFIECNPYMSSTCTHATDVGLTCSVNETCPAGYIGANCEIPCTCKNGICDAKRTGDGTCTSCSSRQWTGTNCDIPCTCTNGYCSGSSYCSLCSPGNYGYYCQPCNCTNNLYCNDGYEGDGQCYANLNDIRLASPFWYNYGGYYAFNGVLEIMAGANYGFTKICGNTSVISLNDANVMCRQLFGSTYGSELGSQPTYTYSLSSPPLYWDTVSSNYVCGGYETLYSSCAYISPPTTTCSKNTAVNLACNVTTGFCGNNLLDSGEQCDGGINCDRIYCTCPANYSITQSIAGYKVGCFPTPVACSWNLWGPWGTCSAQCGSITRTRSFTPAKNNGIPCVGSTTDVRMCNLSECLFTCTDGSVKSLDSCSAQFSGSNSPCLTMTTCANYPSAVCRPDPCNSCAATYFVNGVKVDCAVHINPTGPPVTVLTVLPPPPTGDDTVLAVSQNGASVLIFGGIFMVMGFCFNFINFVSSV